MATRHEFYQTNDVLTLSVFVKNAPPTAAVEISSDSISISFADYSFSLGPLAAAIDPSKSSFKILSTKIEFKLHKLVPAKWAALERSDLEASSAPPALPSAYPSSKGAKDWDKVVVEEIGDKQEEVEGGDPASFFFKKLYADADEDTRRAMMKSYVESNGTALSTNWSEVKKETMKTSPPSGMEAKNWDK
ncbi:SGS-domain-containing protein [Myxozyma melibiosi]|uniref:SGS-domain-containing protein n=1 Tax=Myxozyma melibiosi TaxID=54550 RepID=A0ABR1FB31_9ASCO